MRHYITSSGKMEDLHMPYSVRDYLKRFVKDFELFIPKKNRFQEPEKLVLISLTLGDFLLQLVKS